MSLFIRSLILILLLGGLPIFSENIHNRIIHNRMLPDPYYPQQPLGQLRLNYYYDRSGRWVKFSDWIPYQQRKFVPRHLEDFYEIYGLPNAYTTADLHESIYFLNQALGHKFRHPRYALCKIENPAQYHKYRLLLTMQIHQLIMRMFLRLGSLYDKPYLYAHDLDVADDLETAFMVARKYYQQAIPFWQNVQRYAREASQYRFILDLPGLESERFRIVRGELDFGRIIRRHIAKVDAKLRVTKMFLDKEGRPRPLKKAIQKDIEQMYDKDFRPDPLSPPKI